ncbi:MAG: TlpA family protein disulfide reductase [Fidelibacterota bacterium]|nr:MAG: TlpA family protein disulfide reductase [Candidatus Neomarinimicrobiota bacterium]
MNIKIPVFLLICTSLSFAQIDVGQPAPTFYLPRLEGGSFYLSKVIGSKARAEDRAPVVISFFQTTCVPCKAEIAEFEKLQGEFPAVKIYLVDLNEEDQLVAEYVQKSNLKLEMLLDRYGIVGKKFGAVDENDVALLPNSFIIAMDGTVYYHHTGFKPGDEAVYREKFIELSKQLEKERAALAQESTQKEEQAKVVKQESQAGIEVGQPAPTFSLPRLEGKRFYLSRVVGPKAKPENRKPVVVSFFQTTCVPCKAEIAELEKLQEEYPGVVIYLVDLNETDELVTEYIKRFDLKLQMLMDRYGSVGKKYGVVDENNLAILPNSFIVAPDGNIYYYHTGFKPGDEKIYQGKFEELTSP